MVTTKPTEMTAQVTLETVHLAGTCGTELAATTFMPAADASAGHPNLVYAHGFGQTRGTWIKTASALARQGYAGLAYDARGHGDSQRNAADLGYHGEQFVDDLIIVAGEQPQPPVLVGASMGGLFGLIAESRWPGLFSALVLVDITPQWEQTGLTRILKFATAFPDGFESPEQAAELISDYLPHRPRKTAQELASILRQSQNGRWHWHWDPRLVDDLVRDSAQHQSDIAEAARSIRCPVLLISGGRSDLVSDTSIRGFQSLVPHAEHVQLADAGHMLAGDDNDAFIDAVLTYLRSHSTIPTPLFNTAFDSASGARS